MSARGTNPTKSAPADDRRAVVAQALTRATGRLATAATTRMDEERPWFRDLGAQERSWVGMIVQAGIRGFVEWYAAGAATEARLSGRHTAALASAVFGAAPRALTGVITLQQTVDLVRLSIEVVETHVGDVLEPEDATEVRSAVARYAREVAFATAEVYARAAEQRGAWDARLEALVVDAVLRAETDEVVLSRASALGWDPGAPVAVVLGSIPPAAAGDPAVVDVATPVIEELRRRVRAVHLEALCAVQGDRLVVLLGRVEDPQAAAASVADLFGDGPVVVGPVVAGLPEAHVSARAALAAHRAAPGWPDAPRPAMSEEFLPERALAGDGHARRHLVEHVHRPLAEAKGTLIETLTAYFGSGGSLEATARALYVHPNTVRYRLRQVEDLTGYHASRPRDALVLQLALILGRQSRAL